MAEYTIDDGSEGATLGTPDDGDGWVITKRGTPFSPDAPVKHPTASKPFYVDITETLPPGQTVSAVGTIDIEDITDDDPPTVTLETASAQPNAATFTNHRRDTVAVGKAILFRPSAGDSQRTYRITVPYTLANGSEDAVAVELRIRP